MWKEAAEATRDALALLGYPISPRCLPGEPDSCGGSYRQHLISHLAAAKACADHQLSHAAARPSLVARIYADTAETLENCSDPKSALHQP